MSTRSLWDSVFFFPDMSSVTKPNLQICPHQIFCSFCLSYLNKFTFSLFFLQKFIYSSLRRKIILKIKNILSSTSYWMIYSRGYLNFNFFFFV
jgi:hypothetical protein